MLHVPGTRMSCSELSSFFDENVAVNGNFQGRIESV